MKKHFHACTIASLALITMPAISLATGTQYTISQQDTVTIKSSYAGNKTSSVPDKPAAPELLRYNGSDTTLEANESRDKQQSNLSTYAYCSVRIKSMKLFSFEYAIMLSFDEKWHDNEFPLTTPSGYTITCNSKVQAFNIMSHMGWELIDILMTCDCEESNSSPTKYIFRKKVGDLSPIERWQYEKSMVSLKQQMK